MSKPKNFVLWLSIFTSKIFSTEISQLLKKKDTHNLLDIVYNIKNLELFPNDNKEEEGRTLTL